MTKENTKRLYEHYKSIGHSEALQDLINKNKWLEDEGQKTVRKDNKGSRP